jgi:hypothetical protein
VEQEGEFVEAASSTEAPSSKPCAQHAGLWRMADKARRLAEFQRACALNLATIHAPASAASAAGGSAAVDLELLETWLRENKLSLLFDNIKQRASSLDALVSF